MKDILERTREAPWIEATPLWYEDQYDGGVLTGVCEVHEKKFYFLAGILTGTEEDCYSVMITPPGIVEELERRYRIYEEICGDHMSLQKKCGGG